MSARKRRAEKASSQSRFVPPEERDYTTDPQHKLRHFLSNLHPDAIPSGLHLLVYTREVIEAHKLADKYQTANLFACWCVHTKVHKLVQAYRVLRTVNEHIAKASSQTVGDWETGDRRFLEAGLLRALGVASLRRELREIFQRFSIPAPFLESHSGWFRTFASIGGELQGKPLSYPTAAERAKHPPSRDSFSAAREQILAAMGNTRAFVRQVMIDVVAESPGATQGPVYFMGFTESGVQLRTKLDSDLIESRDAFSRD